MAPRKKDKAKVAARKQKRAGKDVLRDIYDMCPEANSGEAGVTQNGKEFKVLSRKLILLPESIGTLEGLEALNLSCSQLLELPHTIGGLKALTMLDLSECASLTKLPGAIGELKALTELDLSKCSSLAALPDAIGELGALTALDLSACESLTALPDAIGGLKALTTLELRGCTSLTTLPDSIGSMPLPLTLTLHNCTSLVALPATVVKPGGNVEIRGWNKTTVPDDTREIEIDEPIPFPRGQPLEEFEAEIQRRVLEKRLEEIEDTLSDAQRLELRRLRRRVCDACGRQGTLEVERFPVCWCGARRYCDEKCQQVDWDRGHSATCASGHTFPQNLLNDLRVFYVDAESKKNLSKSGIRAVPAPRRPRALANCLCSLFRA